MDVMAMFNGRNFQKLDDVACILGLPGKRGESGYHVPEYVRTEQWLKLTSYCEGDVLNTWFIYLRWLLLKGQMNVDEHNHWISSSIEYLQTIPQQADFLEVWQRTSKHTEFTSHYFNPLNF